VTIIKRKEQNMKQTDLMSKRAFAYLLLTKLIRSAFGFGLFVIAFVSMTMVYGLLTVTSYADPLFNDSFNWLVLAQPLGVAVAIASFIYAMASTLIYRSTKVVRLEEDGVEIESGVILKKVDLIPYSQIKIVEQKQSPLQRIMRFATLSIDYGGWNPRTVEHIAEDKAEKLQDKLAYEAAAAQ
jgi:membrane protein YdbS with pleckstrin-like domain